MSNLINFRMKSWQQFTAVILLIFGCLLPEYKTQAKIDYYGYYFLASDGHYDYNGIQYNYLSEVKDTANTAYMTEGYIDNNIPGRFAWWHDQLNQNNFKAISLAINFNDFNEQLVTNKQKRNDYLNNIKINVSHDTNIPIGPIAQGKP